RRSRARAEKQAKPQAFFLSLTDFLHFPQAYRHKKRVALHHHDIALGSALSLCHGEYVPPKFLTEFQPFHNLPISSANRSSRSKGKRISRGSNVLNHLNLLNRCHALVPPTVRPSILMVGSPTPTGTDWPSLPHVPIPSSSFKSEPTIETRVRTSGPLPISVAPLTGLVTLPSSIKKAFTGGEQKFLL